MKKIVVILCGGIAAAAVVIMIWGIIPDRHHHLTVTFLDVGQGDSILIETPSGQVILIDGGPDRAVLAELGRSLPVYERTIDLLVLTHGDADHVTGLVEVLHRYDVQRVLYTGVEKRSVVYETWLDAVNDEGATRIAARRGQVFTLGETTVEVLFPFSDLSGQAREPINDTSLFLRVVYGETEYLFTGDASIAIEQQLIEHAAHIDADVLKVGHHGSASSSSSAFLERVSPQIAVIQVGEGNAFDHPRQEVLDRLRAVGSRVLRTDQVGKIVLTSDGRRIMIDSERPLR